HFKRDIFKNWLISFIVVSIVYFIFVYLGVSLFKEIYYEYILNNISLDFAAVISEYYIFVFLIIYVMLIIMLALHFMMKTAGYVEKSYKAISNLTNEKRENINYPKIMDNFKIKVLEVENELLFKERAAREAEQKKNDLIVYLAHDLKTPLTSIIGYLNLLQESPDLPVEYRVKYTGITLDKAYRLEQLINEFFDITRFNLQSVVLENNRVDLSMLLNQIIEEFYPVFAQKNITVKTSIAPNITLIADADKLARVFDNLLRNAVNYSYSDTQLRLFAKADEQFAYICVRNTGDEIPKEKLDLIFEKFFRADSARGTQNGGAGLGLAIAKEIVELHHGTISANSNKDFTDFIVTLPLKM
ncbi:MAG: HAMP domain-containing histidine kinase, partial [Eubacterium sp.]|nr:HAMP domain-containing histidine kinase [Eubacterium sp.]